MQQKTQTFNDGIVNICSPLHTIADDLTVKIAGIRYAERTVGFKRFWDAKTYNSTIEQILRIPRIPDIILHDIAIPNDGCRYDIIQIQTINDVYPNCLDLSLERIGSMYINPVDMNKIITIVYTDSKTGVTNKIIETYAKISNTSGSQILQNNVSIDDVKTSFIIRCPQRLIDSSMTIHFNGKVYSIKYVNNLEESNMYIEIIAEYKGQTYES